MNGPGKKSTMSPSKKRIFYFVIVNVFIIRKFFLAAPPPEPSRPSSSPSRTTAAANESTTSPPSSAIAHLMSQIRMDKPSEPMPTSLKNLEKMSITETQRLLAENGLDK